MGGEGRYFVKVIRHDGMVMVNLCDEELVGTTVREGGIEMHIAGDYFRGEPVNKEQALELLRSCSVANLVGRRIVEEALQAKLASHHAVKRIGQVSFLMIFKFTR